MKTLEILFIDDHPMILEGYESTLKTCEEYKVNVHIQTTLTNAYEYIVKHNKLEKFDLIIFDVGMSEESTKYSLRSGIDLAIEIDKITKHPRLAFLTMIDDQFQIDRIIKDINPSGILFKNDIGPKTLKSSIIEIMSNPPCYSPSIKSKIRAKSNFKLDIDEVDQSILYHISKGVITKNIGDVIYLSHSTVEKRKKRIKELFEVENESDFALIEEAKKRGFL